jgi:hypothetical protein
LIIKKLGGNPGFPGFPGDGFPPGARGAASGTGPTAAFCAQASALSTPTSGRDGAAGGGRQQGDTIGISWDNIGISYVVYIYIYISFYIIICHYISFYIIIYHYTSSYIIIYHFKLLCIIIYHYILLCIIRYI